MKKHITILLIATLLLILGGCAGDDSSEYPLISLNPYETYICYAGYNEEAPVWKNALNAGTFFTSTPLHPIYKIESTDDLAAFQETMEPYLHLGSPAQSSPNFYHATRDCNDAYFADNALLVVYVCASSGSYCYDVASVFIQNSSLKVSINENSGDGVGTDDMSGWFIILKVPKTDLVGVTTYNAGTWSKFNSNN